MEDDLVFLVEDEDFDGIIGDGEKAFTFTDEKMTARPHRAANDDLRSIVWVDRTIAMVFDRSRK